MKKRVFEVENMSSFRWQSRVPIYQSSKVISKFRVNWNRQIKESPLWIGAGSVPGSFSAWGPKKYPLFTPQWRRQVGHGYFNLSHEKGMRMTVFWQLNSWMDFSRLPPQLRDGGKTGTLFKPSQNIQPPLIFDHRHIFAMHFYGV